MATNKYLAFSKVAELKNLTRAAEALNCTQSAISQIINSLENDLGFPLIIRKKSGVALTDNGKKILIPIQNILTCERIMEQRQKNILGLKEGLLKISTFPSANMQLLSPIVGAFIKKFPKVEFEILHGNYDTIRQDLLNDRADCAFLVDEYIDDLEFTPLLTDPFYVVLPAGHELTQYEAISLDKLANQPIIFPSEAKNYDAGKLLRQIPGAHVRMSTQNDYAAVALVERELGITFLPQLVLSNLKTTAVCRPLLPAYARNIGIAVHERKYASPLVLEFVDFVGQWLQTTPAGNTGTIKISLDKHKHL